MDLCIAPVSACPRAGTIHMILQQNYRRRIADIQRKLHPIGVLGVENGSLQPSLESTGASVQRGQESNRRALHAGMQDGNRLVGYAELEMDRQRRAQDAIRKLVEAVGQIGESGTLCKTEGDLAAGEQCGDLIRLCA
jgi:hypothetical protein